MLGNLFYKGLCVCALALLILSPLRERGRSQQASGAGVDSERLARIPLRMKSFVERGTIAGAVMLLARGGKVLSVEAVGYQDLESKRPMRVDTIFDIRSVTKPVTALGIMILMEEGRLALHDPVEKYLPEFRKTASGAQGAASGPITIYQLLTHTSGIPSSRPREIEDITVTRDRTLAEVVALLSKQEPEFAPGTQFRYSSSGFAILGRVIEVVSGKPFEQFMKERVFDPLGMKDSFFFIPAGKWERVASIYRMENGRLKKWDEIREYSRKAKYSAPEFGMYSTAADLAALCQMMLDGGSFKGRRILSRASVEAMTQNHTLTIRSVQTGRPAFQGLAWGLAGDPVSDFPLTSAGSYGHNGAFGSIIWIDPKKGLIRIFLQHLFGGGNESNIFMAMAGAAVTD